MLGILQPNGKLLAAGEELRCVAKASLISVLPAGFFLFMVYLNVTVSSKMVKLSLASSLKAYRQSTGVAATHSLPQH
jgi:hypothetical protein